MSRRRIIKTERKRELADGLYKRKRLFFLSCIALMLLIVWGENKLISRIESNNSYLKQSHAEDDIVVSPGYEVTGDVYRVANENPYIIFKSVIDNIDTIDIKFKEKIKKDTNVMVYCLKKGQKFSEENKIEVKIEKGAKTAWIAVPSGKYGSIRMDIAGDFVLDDISFSGFSPYRIPTNVRNIIYIMDFLVILFMVFCYRRENLIFSYLVAGIERCHPLVDLMKKNIVRVVFFIVGVVLFLRIIEWERDWLEEVKTDVTTTREQVYTSKDIVSSKDYKRKKDAFVQDGDDPQFVFKGDISKVNRVKVYLRKSEYNDMYIKVFYRKKGEDFSEINTSDGHLWAYHTDTEVKINEGNYESIRIDLDGSFELDHVSFYKYVDNDIPMWCYLTVAVIDILFVILWGLGLIFIRYNKVYEFLLLCCRKCKGWYIFANRKTYYLGNRYSIRLEKLFLALGLVLGIAYSILIPPGQVPDESTHVTYMRSSLGYGEKMDKEIASYHGDILSGELLLNPYGKQSVHLLQKHAGKKFTPEARELKHFPTIQTVRYLPTAIGYLICVSLNLPIYFCLQIAEICSVIFYAVLGYFALKGMPIMKGALFTVMLLPMTLQQCSSVSYDVIVLTGSFWVFSYLVKCIAVKEQVGWKDVLILAAWFVPIVLTKLPYVVIFALFFAIPKEKVALPVKGIGNVYAYICKYWYIATLAVVLVVGFVILPRTIYNDVIKSALAEFQHTLSVFDGTVNVYKEFWTYSIVGNFGWLVRPMPERFIKLSYALMAAVALCSAGYMKKDGTVVRMWNGLIVWLGFIIVCLGLVPWTFMISNIDTGSSFEEYRKAYLTITSISGIQGRYFIPLIPLLMYFFHGVIRLNRKNHVCVTAIVFGIWIIWPISSILSMFW